MNYHCKTLSGHKVSGLTLYKHFTMQQSEFRCRCVWIDGTPTYACWDKKGKSKVKGIADLDKSVIEDYRKMNIT